VTHHIIVLVGVHLLYMTDGQDQWLASIRLDRYMLYLSLGTSPLLLCSGSLIDLLGIVPISVVCTVKRVIKRISEGVVRVDYLVIK